MRPLADVRRDLSKFVRYHLVRRTVTFPAREEDLGIVPLAFDLDVHVAAVRAFDGPRYEVRTEQTIEYQGCVHPILVARERTDAPRTLLVLAGVHGNEHAGLLAVPRILAAAPHPGVRLVVVTPVNPVGAAALSRLNGEGYDVNRDFVRFDTPEARTVRDVYAREKPDFVISLHEGPQDASFLFTNRHVPLALANQVLERLAAGGTTLADRDYFGLQLRPRGLSSATPVRGAVEWLWAKVVGMKATLGYSADLAIPEIVLESSWRQTREEERIRPHVDVVAAVAQAMALSSGRAE